MASLQEQLLKAGIADEKKAKKIKQEQRKAKKANKGKPQVDEGKLAAQRALAEKAERDREINRQRQAEVEKKAIYAQILQLVDINKVDRKQGDIAFQFTDGKKIKRIYVTNALQEQLVKGLLAIVKVRDNFELVPAVIADKIIQRDASVIVLHNDKPADQPEEDDPYADYQIPDDLMW